MANFSVKDLFSNPQVTNERILNPVDGEKILVFLMSIDFFANEKLGLYPESQGKFDLEMRQNIRNEWYNKPEVIDEFLEKYKSDISDSDKLVIQRWKNVVQSEFVCLKYFPEYAVFIDTKKNEFYAVKGLTSDFDQTIEIKPPYICRAALLPFNDVIVWDGLIRVGDMQLSRADMFELSELAKKMRRYNGLITSLPQV